MNLSAIPSMYGTGEFSAQMASNAENVSIWWRHHELRSLSPELCSELVFAKDIYKTKTTLSIFYCIALLLPRNCYDWYDASEATVANMCKYIAKINQEPFLHVQLTQNIVYGTHHIFLSGIYVFAFCFSLNWSRWRHVMWCPSPPCSQRS